jgi:hypothetical protein
MRSSKRGTITLPVSHPDLLVFCAIRAIGGQITALSRVMGLGAWRSR